MKFYYTVSSGQDEKQNKLFNSLGAYRSSTILQNDEFNNLFGEISVYTIKKNRKEYIGLILKNETGVDVTNIRIWFDYPALCYSKFKISAVDLLTDTEGIQYLDRVQDRYSKPTRADFYEADGEANAVDLGDMLKDTSIGIWFERTLNISLIESDYNIENRITKTGNIYVETPLLKEDIIDIILDWDE